MWYCGGNGYILIDQCKRIESPEINPHTYGQLIYDEEGKKRSKIVSFVETWMKLESVIESEVGQKEKNEYHILMHICGIYKNGI